VRRGERAGYLPLRGCEPRVIGTRIAYFEAFAETIGLVILPSRSTSLTHCEGFRTAAR